MIEKLNQHFSFTNPASIHDEEALTALELAGRQGAKINEIVEDQNALRQETGDHLGQQDEKIAEIKAETISEQQIKDAVNQIDCMIWSTDLFSFAQSTTLDGAMKVHFLSGSSIKARIGGISGEYFLTGVFISGIDSTYKENTTEGTFITIPSYTALVLDRSGEQHTLALRENSSLLADDIVLIQNSWNELTGGKLMEWYLIQTQNRVKGSSYAYLGEGTTLSVTDNGDDIRIDIEGKMSVVSDTVETVPWVASSDTNLENVRVYSEEKIRVFLPNYSCFYYDTVSKTVGIRDVTTTYNLKPTEISLFENRYQTIIGGCLADQRNDKAISDLCYQSVGFLGYNQKLEFSLKSDSTGYTVKFPCRISVIRDQSVAVEWSSLGDSLTDNLTVDGNTATLDLPNHNAFVYNTGDGLLHLRASGQIQQSDVVLLQNAWCNLITGSLLVEWYGKKLSELESSAGSGATVNVPVPEALQFAKVVANTIHPINILYFTDPHLVTKTGNWYDNFHKVMSKIKAVCDTLPIDAVVCGGDWLDGHTKDEAISALSYINGQMRSMFPNFIHVVGNHDYNYQGDERLNEDEVCKLLLNRDAPINPDDMLTPYGKVYYYGSIRKGNIDNKITFADVNFGVLDTGIDWEPQTVEYIAEQESEVIQKVVSESAGYPVIFMHAAHELNSETGEYYTTDLMNSVKETAENYLQTDSCTSEVQVFGGHIHANYTESFTGGTIYSRRNLLGEDGIHFDLICFPSTGWDITTGMTPTIIPVTLPY